MSHKFVNIASGDEPMSLTEEARENIRRALAVKGWDQKQLAFAMHRTEAWASKLLKNKKEISLDLLQQIADVLGVKVFSLLPESMKAKDEGRANLDDYIGDIVERKLAEKRER